MTDQLVPKADGVRKQLEIRSFIPTETSVPAGPDVRFLNLAEHDGFFPLVASHFNKHLEPLCGSQTSALKRIREAKDRTCELLLHGGELVGILVYKSVPTKEYESVGIANSLEMKTLFVCDPEFNSGRGFGTTLLRRAAEVAVSAGADGIHVTCSSTKQQVLDFFAGKEFVLKCRFSLPSKAYLTPEVLLYHSSPKQLLAFLQDHVSWSSPLPLVAQLLDSFSTVDLNNVSIIGVQHLLPTTYSMFKSLFGMGLQPGNVYLLGKAYSTIDAVAELLTRDGVYVSPESIAFNDKLPYDMQLDAAVDRFISHVQTQIKNQDGPIIVLDDGGALINGLSQTAGTFSESVTAVEQTTSGLRKIQDMTCVPCPIINVARSKIKLEQESGFIGDAIVEETLRKAFKYGLGVRKTMVIGDGAIGKAVRMSFSERGISSVSYDCTSCFQNPDLKVSSDIDVVVGCTGSYSFCMNSIGDRNQPLLVVSGSSSDREFDAVTCRGSGSCPSRVHSDVCTKRFILANNGFPINFTGSSELEQRSHIQLTRALLVAAILQALSMKEVCPGVYQLSPQSQGFISSRYRAFCGEDAQQQEFYSLDVPYIPELLKSK